LAAVKDLVELDPDELAERLTLHWNDVDAQHAARRELVTALVDRLTRRSSVVNDVASREMPARRLLCLKRNVHEAEAWALGKEFIGIIRDRGLPRIQGRAGAMFSIYWGQVSEDSDGPMEMCRPVPDAEAAALAEQFPALTLRMEPAHREAYVDLGRAGPAGIEPARFALAEQALWTWAEKQRIEDPRFALNAGNLGMRITYLASQSPSETTGPDCDLAVPYT
jgi:hypothetical protein